MVGAVGEQLRQAVRVKQRRGLHEAHLRVGPRGGADDRVHLRGAAPRVRGVDVLGVRRAGEDPDRRVREPLGQLVEVGSHVALDARRLTGLVAVVLAELHDDGRRVHALGEADERAGLEDLAAQALVHEVEPQVLGEKRAPGARGVARDEALRDGVPQHDELATSGHGLEIGPVAGDGTHGTGGEARQPDPDVMGLAHAGEVLEAGLGAGRWVVEQPRDEVLLVRQG